MGVGANVLLVLYARDSAVFDNQMMMVCLENTHAG